MALSKRLKQNLSLLKKLKNCKSPVLRRQILKKVPLDTLVCLIECIANVVYRKVYISKKQKRGLAKHIGILRNLVSVRSKSLVHKKLVQTGTGIIPLILAPILSAAAGLIADKISGK